MCLQPLDRPDEYGAPEGLAALCGGGVGAEAPEVRGPALPVPKETYEKIEGVLRDVGLLTVREVG